MKNGFILNSLTPTPSLLNNQNLTPPSPSLKPTPSDQNISLTYDLNNGTCPSITKTLKRCPAGYNTNGNKTCKLIYECDSSIYNNCPKIIICHLDKGDCPAGIKCPEGYLRLGIKGDCKRHTPCESSKDCSQVCNLFKGDCPATGIICNTNSTNSNDTSCRAHKDGNGDNNPDQTDSVIQYYITNPIIQQQVAQQPSNTLIPMNTTQFCKLIGDQACVFMNSNFKILFNQTTKDNFGNWNLNGESQNIGANPLNNVMVV